MVFLDTLSWRLLTEEPVISVFTGLLGGQWAWKRRYCSAWRRSWGRKEDPFKRMGRWCGSALLNDFLCLLEWGSSGCIPGYSPHVSPGLPCRHQQKHSGCAQRAPGLQQRTDLREWAEPVLIRVCGGWGALWKRWDKLQYPANHGFIKPANELLSQLLWQYRLCQRGGRRCLQLPEHLWHCHTVFELSYTESMPSTLASHGDPELVWVSGLSIFFSSHFLCSPMGFPGSWLRDTDSIRFSCPSSTTPVLTTGGAQYPAAWG